MQARLALGKETCSPLHQLPEYVTLAALLSVNTSKLPEITLPKDCQWHYACLQPQIACNGKKADRIWCCSLGHFGLPCLAGRIQLSVVSQCKANFRLQLTHHHPHHTSSKCPHGFWTIAQLQSPHMPAATATRHVVTM